MKKTFLFLITLAMLITSLWSNAYSVQAESNVNTDQRVVSETTAYFEDGSYMTIIVTETSREARGAVYDKTGASHGILHDKNGNELWRFTVYGSFSVNPGVSATCTSASYSISITDSAWQNQSASASYSGNQAAGDATFIRKLLGITVETKGCHVVLTCDSNGNLS